MKPRGEDTADAIVSWFKDEIKNSSAGLADLGKFFFGASSGAVGVLLTLVKVGDKFAFNILLSYCLVLYLISIFVSIFMVRPRIWLVTGNTDLYEEYKTTVRRGIRLIWTWFAFWIFATVLAVVSLYAQYAPAAATGSH